MTAPTLPAVLTIGYTPRWEQLPATSTTLASLVAQGIMQPVPASQDSDHLEYYPGHGRLFLSSLPSNLRYFAGIASWGTSRTLAARVLRTPITAGEHGLALLATAGGEASDIRLSDLAALIYVLNTDPGSQAIWQAGPAPASEVACVVGRHDSSSVASVNLNGVESTTTAGGKTPNTPTQLVIGDLGGSYAADGYVGPVIFSPTRKNDAWVAALQANGGAAYDDLANLCKRHLAVGDYLFPLQGDSVGYKKVSTAPTVAPTTGLLVCDGNSMTSGTTVAFADSYPEQVRATVSAALHPINLGVPSQTTADMLFDVAEQVDGLYDDARPYNIACVWEGGNHLTEGASVGDAYAALVEYCQGRRALGFSVVVLTVLPRTVPAWFDASRNSLNALIVANWPDFADAIADVAANHTIGDDGDAANTTYYNADGVHMTAAGYAIVAGIVKTAVEALL